MFRLLLVLTFGFSFVATACAQLFTPVSQNRELFISIDDFSGFPALTATSSAPNFNLFNDSIMLSDMGIPSSFGDAEQNSSIDTTTNQFIAMGAVSGSPSWNSGDTNVISESRYEAVFDTVEALRYSATGTGDTERFVGNALEAFTFASVGINLRDVTTGLLVFSRVVAIDDSGPGMVNEVGVIPAGRYEISMFGGVDALAEFNDQFPSATATYDMTFELSRIPEPTGIALLATGVMLPAIVRPRRNRS